MYRESYTGGDMTVIWQRKKNMILTLLIGFMLGAVPLGIVLTVGGMKYMQCRDSIAKIKEDNMSKSKKRVMVLSKDLSKGDTITENDLIEKEIYCENEVDCLSSFSQVEGRSIKINADKGTILDADMLCETEKIPDDLRLQLYSNINLHSGILEGSIVDIRITFPNGEDYIIAEHKQVKSRIEDSILIEVDEAEILKLASANVDTSTYEGAKIYAILYIEDYQEPAHSDYPVNRNIIELGNWDPNLVNKIFTEDMVNNRNVLESNLNEFTAYNNS